MQTSLEKTIEKIQKGMADHNTADDRRFAGLSTDMDEIKTSLKLLNDNMQPVIKWFSNMTWGKGVVMGILKLVSIIVGIAIAIVALIKN